MRFQKAESAFFVFMTLVLLAGVMLFHAYGVLRGPNDLLVPGSEQLGYLGRLIFGVEVLLATAIFFGIFFIYPLIRRQVKEEDKLRAMTRSLSARSDTMEQAALTDALTGMQNRRYFDDALREYIVAFERIGKPVGLMILDLDRFKSINDTHGHDVGDDVLRAVGTCLQDLTRYHDVVARLGGEEFAVVTPNMDKEMLTKFAERIRKAVSIMSVKSGNVTLKVTTSVGLAVWNGEESADDLYRRADQQLYQAKRMGRNKVCA